MNAGPKRFEHTVSLIAATCVLLTGSLLCSANASAESTIIVDAGESVHAAVAKARKLRARKPDESIGIELAAGTHFLEAPLLLVPADSGTRSAPLEIRGVSRAAVTLSGGRKLGPLSWTLWRSGIWRAKVSGPAFDLLWSGEQRLIRARYPNFDPARRPFGGVAADATSVERVRSWSDPAGGVIHALHSARWGGMQIAIRGKRADGTLELAEPTNNNRTLQMGPSETERFVENIFEELDAPREWYFDRKRGWLYYMPPAGQRPSPTGFIVSRHDHVVMIKGSAAKPVHDIVLANISVKHSTSTALQATEPLLRSDWKFSRAGAVVVEGGHRIQIRDSDFVELGGNAIVVSGHGREISITGNAIANIGGTGIAFVGLASAVRSPLFEYHESQPLAAIDRARGPGSEDYPADSTAADNLIHDIGLIDKQASGVQISMAARISVDHNSIYRVPRAGINVSEGTWGGHRITHNDVFETVLETGDHGAFNSWGRDRFWHPDRDEMNRRVAAERSLVDLDAIETTVIRHNRFHCDHGWDIDLDDGSSNYVIENNLLLAGGLKLREGFNRIARNNIMLNNTLHPHLWFGGSGDVFERNIVMKEYQPIQMEHWGKSVDGNLLPDEAVLKRSQERGTDRHSVAGDADFVDPGRGDFSVSPSSPAKAIGFQNFSMSDFGVTSERLRALAERPRMPQLVYSRNSAATIEE